MRLAAIIAAPVTAVAIFVLAGSAVHAQSETNTSNHSSEQYEKVTSGDTLSSIAHKHDTVYARLFDANEKIKDPDLIYPGQRIRIPAASEELPRRGTQSAVSTPEPVAAAPTPAPTPNPEPAPAPQQSQSRTSANVGDGVWDRLAQCESTGNWSINTGNGYYGGLQFSLSSWQAVGGNGYPHQASKAEQINRAERLLAIQGWGAWPACSAQLGLR